MKRIIGAINMTLDGFCDHTAVNPDEEIHDYYGELLRNGGIALYGRITYGLMEYWKTLLDNPTGEKSMDDFAVDIDRIPKVVFSHTLKNVDWDTARIATRDLKEEVSALKASGDGRDGDILACSRSIIIELINLGLIDEFQVMVHPVIAGGGLPLFEMIKDRTLLKLARTRTFGSGAVMFYYELEKGSSEE